MLLSNKYNFLFVHIAKTGGTSVRAALQPLRWHDPAYYPMWLCSKLSGLMGHRIRWRPGWMTRAGLRYGRPGPELSSAKPHLPQYLVDQLAAIVGRGVARLGQRQVARQHRTRLEAGILVQRRP